MHQYRTGPWYPFHKNGRIDDPKSTAAVGAMLCLLSRSLRLPNFFFRSAAFKPYSTVRFIGMIDNNNAIKDANLFYRNIDLDNEDYEFPDTTFEMRGSMRLGFRQLETERWPASPLYTLSVDDRELREKLASKGLVLKVSLRRSERSGPESFELASVEGGSKSKIKFDSILTVAGIEDVIAQCADHDDVDAAVAEAKKYAHAVEGVKAAVFATAKAKAKGAAVKKKKKLAAKDTASVEEARKYLPPRDGCQLYMESEWHLRWKVTYPTVLLPSTTSACFEEGCDESKRNA
jgi:hypothetical protein